MIEIRGSSDDLVDVEGCVDADEFDVYNKPCVLKFVDPDTQAGLRVVMQYDIRFWGGSVRNGCWGAFVQQLEEDMTFPWPVVLRAEKYTTIVEIDAPASTLCVREVL